MISLHRAASVPTLAVVLAALTPSLDAQTIRGRVAELDSDAPVAAARVTLVDDTERVRGDVLSDSAGTFHMLVPGPGAYVIGVERIGYETVRSQAIPIAGGEVVLVQIELGIEAVSLEPVVVTERRAARGWLREYYERLDRYGRSGLGRFITRADIERRGAVFMSSLLVTVPGLSLTPDRFGELHVRMGRGARGCIPQIYINGALASDGMLPIPVDALVHPDQLEGIEVYSSAWALPPEYSRPGSCGAILAWTRLDVDPEARFSWTKMIIGGTAMVVIVLLGFVMD